jgi:hypothetical protein
MAKAQWSRMDLKEFHDSGLLAHVNQAALWPLGLALTVSVDKEGDEMEYLELFIQRLDPFEPIVSGDSPKAQERRADALAEWIKERVRG